MSDWLIGDFHSISNIAVIRGDENLNNALKFNEWKYEA